MTDRTTYEIQRDIEDACHSIRRTWDHMWAPLRAAQPRRASSSAGILAKGDDDSPRSDDVGGIDNILSVRREALECLQFWARVIVDRRPVTATNFYVTDTSRLCRFLETHADWMSGQEDGEDCADELEQWARTCRNIAHPPRKDWLSIGDCPVTVGAGGSVVTCGTQVRVYPDKPGDVRCHGCGTTDTMDGWILRMCGQEGLLTPAELVIKLGIAGHVVKPAAIWQWRRRGVITPSGEDEQGRPLYDRIAVLAALKRHAS